MSAPKLSVPASGLGGRGYRNPFTGEVVPGVTSVLGVIDKPGILNFHIENTVAYAVTHIDDLLSRTEDQGMGFLRYYTRRMKQKTLDDPTVDVLNYTFGVLDDLAELGTFIHTYAEAEVNGWFTPDPWRPEQQQQVNAYEEWRSENEMIPVATECTVFGNGYGGTADFFGTVNGTPTLVDYKSSRRVYDSHQAQLAAMGAADVWAREVEEGTEGAVYYKIVPSVAKEHGGQVDSWWVAEPVPAFSEYAILQIRPDDWDAEGNYIPAFAKLHTIDQTLIEAGWDLFTAALAARYAQRRRKEALKALGTVEEPDEI